MEILPIAGITLLLAGWTAAWLNWLFNGEIRQFVVSFFPESWRAGVSRSTIRHMNSEEFIVFLCGVSNAPAFLRGVLSCPLCLSAHIAGSGALLSIRPLYILSGGLWELIPLVWATAGVVGFLSVKKHL